MRNFGQFHNVAAIVTFAETGRNLPLPSHNAARIPVFIGIIEECFLSVALQAKLFPSPMQSQHNWGN
ncbi:hypothetical protein [Yoonia sp. SS1-5]|uniref:Uncharacterized protein n=1 Tax=Yoonia rhodophyticola TaxID=3137370 RepID=A0AAN0M8I3_9RHOB